MLEISQSWNLFGYDLRRVPLYFRSGWREFLWGSESPVLRAIDEVVEVHQETGEALYYRAGSAVVAAADSGAVLSQAVLLPDRLVLAKTLRVPEAAEAELESVVRLEVNASSPFPGSDTCYGWAIGKRREKDLEVQLVIASRSAVMSFIAALMDSHDAAVCEVWAGTEGLLVLLLGFGEVARQQRNQRRLTRMALTLAYCLAILVALFAWGAGAKYFELQNAQAIAAQADQRASEAVKLRAELASAKANIVTINELLAEHPDPHAELNKLAAILGDDTWIATAELKGTQMKIEGESEDAAAVMQQLLDDPAYARVVAPVAIRKVRSGMEYFVLNITLAAQGDSE
ncbi:MAG: PilN domain-containing protein [Halioglobus sp.]|nr:PilN domain-containing protein [Halioglobus sp.]